jgi:hypothetical protein
MITEIYISNEDRSIFRPAETSEENFVLCPGKLYKKENNRWLHYACGSIMASTGEIVPFSKPARVVMICPRCGAKATILQGKASFMP